MATPTVSRAELARCAQAGAKAGEAGESAKACPHSPASSDVDERLRAAAWVRAYVRATRGAREGQA